MNPYFSHILAAKYGYTMAVYIAAETFDLQRAIDYTNVNRLHAGRLPLEDARVQDVIDSLRTRGMLPAERNAQPAPKAKKPRAGSKSAKSAD